MADRTETTTTKIEVSESHTKITLRYVDVSRHALTWIPPVSQKNVRTINTLEQEFKVNKIKKGQRNMKCSREDSFVQEEFKRKKIVAGDFLTAVMVKKK
jgi:hypothetical protein